MVKIVALLSSARPSEAVSVPVLIDRLKTQWLPGGLPAAGLRGLVVSEVFQSFDETSTVTAMAQLWRDEAADKEKGVANLLPDPAAAGDYQINMWTAREHVYRAPRERERTDSPKSIVKLAGTALRRDDFTKEAFFDYWQNKHAPIGGVVPGLGGYVVSEALEQLAGDLSLDAVLELWYPDQATYEATETAPQQEAAWNDVPNYAKTTGVYFWLMREFVILAPPPTAPGSLEVKLEAEHA